MTESATAERPARVAGRAEAFYNATLAYEAEGMTRAAAFQRIADEHGTTKANVQTAFYRWARTHPDGAVKHRAGSKTGAEARRRGASASTAPVAAPARAPRATRAPRASTNGAGKQGDALRAMAAELRRAAQVLEHEATVADANGAIVAGIRGVVNGKA